MKKALAWELEDQLTELKELLSLSHITQEEYEQKKKLLEKMEVIVLLHQKKRLDSSSFYIYWDKTTQR